MMPASSILGYCTNVHAGDTWPATRENLQTHAAAVRQLICADSPLPVGLWLAHDTLNELLNARGIDALSDLCDELGLLPFTFNGFPYGNFHQAVVKHAVYQPAWDRPERAAYTIALAKLHAALAAGPCERSISTLPLGWGDPARTRIDLEAAIANLQSVAVELAKLHVETGVLVHVDIEPEPGCLLERSDDVLALFKRLVQAADENSIRTHLRVCHDVCHAAVMDEQQAEVLERYRAAGIRVGKVQFSSALRLDLANRSDRERAEALAQLQPFADDRYLHQTLIDHGEQRVFHEDLTQALAEAVRNDRLGDQWRVHYHVPIFLDRLGMIETTQQAIIDCINAIEVEDDIQHFEVETYTWNILPESMRSMSLAEGIARELRWAHERCHAMLASGDHNPSGSTT